VARGGNEFQSLSYNLGVNRDWLGGEVSFKVDADWNHDSNQLFGNPKGRQWSQTDRGVSPSVQWRFPGDKPKALFPDRFGYGIQVQASLPVRHTRIFDDAAKTEIAVGNVSAFSTDISGGMHFNFQGDADKPKGGLGQTSASFHATARNAFRAVGGDFRFDQYSLDLNGRVPFGWTRSDQFLISYRRGFRTGSAGAPLFELFRLGGPNSVRGIEMGEFVGRSLSFDQSEFGYNLREPIAWIAKLLGAKKKTEAGKDTDPRAKQADPLAALGISSALIKVFHDRGLVSQGTLGRKALGSGTCGIQQRDRSGTRRSQRWLEDNESHDWLREVKCLVAAHRGNRHGRRDCVLGRERD